MNSEAIALPRSGAPTRGRFGSFDARFAGPVLITCILAAADLSFGILEGYGQTAFAIVTAMLSEVVFGRISYGRWPHLASAYITGISVGILVRSPFWWPYFLCSLISITSKYVLRVDGRHLWNPSNFGVSALLLLAPATTSVLSFHWGNEIWAMAVIWLLGFVIVSRVGRGHISAAYVVSFVLFTFLRSALQGEAWLANVAPITGPMYQLFIFFMVTDPRTTVQPKWAQVVVVIVVAFVEMLFRMAEVVYAPFFALFLVGPSALMIEILLTRRRARA